MTLSTTSLAGLLRESAGIIAAGRPLGTSLRELNVGSLGSLGRAAGRVADAVDSGQSAAAALAAESGPHADLVTAALMSPAHGDDDADGHVGGDLGGHGDRLLMVAEHLRRLADDRRQLRLAWLHPVIVVTLTYALMSLVMTSVAIGLDENRLIGVRLNPLFVDISRWTRQWFWIPPLVAGSAWLIARGRGVGGRWNRWNSWDRWSGHADHRWAVFCETLAMQRRFAGSAGSTSVPEELRSASAALRPDERAMLLSPIINRLATGQSIDDFEGLPPLLRYRVSRLGVAGGTSADSLDRLAFWYRQRGRERHLWWTRWFPRLIATTTMTLAAMIVCVFMLAPVYAGIAELAR